MLSQRDTHMRRGCHHLVGGAEYQALPIFGECFRFHNKIMMVTYEGGVHKQDGVLSCQREISHWCIYLFKHSSLRLSVS